MKIPFLSILACVAFASAGLAFHTLATPTAGPPAVCFPLEIGADSTIPDQFSASFAPESLTDRVAKDLSGSDRTLVHMESLRCATLAIMAGERSPGRDISKDQLAHQLISRLRWNLVQGLAAAKPLGDRELGLLWFDLAFAQGAMGQALDFDQFGCEEAMLNAMALLPTDASAQFGCALSMWEYDQFQELGFYPRMQATLDLESAGDVDPSLLGNVLFIGGSLLGTQTRAELATMVTQRLAGN